MVAQGALIDTFIAPGFRGNPAYVINGSRDLSVQWMQELANELNQAETAFLVQHADSTWALRWFTPTTEVELCGHATMAAAFWLWENNLALAQELYFLTASGKLTARRMSNGEVQIFLPALPFCDVPSTCDLSDALSCDNFEYLGITNNDNPRERNLGVRVEDNTLRELQPNFEALAKLPVGGVIVTASSDSPDFDFLSRYFAPSCGIPEDHVTGSAHCSLAWYWANELGRTQMTACQVSARGGVITVNYIGNFVELSGRCRIVADIFVK
jgi:PhzF family phenazine biosynthesis protein